ncbi:MAG: hypothetical protein ACKVVT_03780 [Dehalococcoidia bacterium]
MQYQGPTLVLFHGRGGDGEAEQLVDAARVAMGRETARLALEAGFQAVIVATNAPDGFAGMPANVIVDPDAPGEPFDFADRLGGVVRRFALARPAVMGAGAVPLIGRAELAAVADHLTPLLPRVVTNNFFSSDLTAWTPGDAIFRAGAFLRDNELPRRLRDNAGLTPVSLPRSTATQFDLDTPADVVVLAIAGLLPDSVRAATPELRLPTPRYRALMKTFTDRSGELLIAGRVGSQTWQHLETQTACRVRLLSEERGLAAAGKGHQARSVLGFLLAELGTQRFFRTIGELGTAAVIDARVLEAHLGLAPSREDRFQSDLMNAAGITDSFLRKFTQAAVEAPIPVILGGHSLVTGGLALLNDVAWEAEGRG